MDKESAKVWMELIDGQTLRAAAAAHSPDPLAMAAQVGEIIGRMHHSGRPLRSARSRGHGARGAGRLSNKSFIQRCSPQVQILPH